MLKALKTLWKYYEHSYFAGYYTGHLRRSHEICARFESESLDNQMDDLSPIAMTIVIGGGAVVTLWSIFYFTMMSLYLIIKKQPRNLFGN